MAKANLQTVIVSKGIAATRAQATKVARPHANRIYTSRETQASWRFRQRPPTDFVKGTFRTFKIPEEPGVSLVYGELKTDKATKKKRTSKSRRKNPANQVTSDYESLMAGEMSLRDFTSRHDVKAIPKHRSKGPYFAYDCGSHANQILDKKYGGRGTWEYAEEGISWEEAKAGDYITWNPDSMMRLHQGLIIDPETHLVESCWGVDGYVFQHDADNSPYGTNYRLDRIQARNPKRRVKKPASKNPPVTRTQLRRWQRYNERAAEATNLKDLANLAKKGREWMKDERMLYVFDSEVAERATVFGVKCNLKDVKSVRRCVGDLIKNQGRTLFDNPSKRRVLRNPKVMPDPGPSAWLGGLLEWAWDGKDGEYLWEPNGEWIFLWSPELKAVVGIPMPRNRKKLAKVSRKSGGAKMFERFTARDAENTYEISIPQVKLEKLGKAKHIVYRSDKWNPGEDTDYIHDFKEGVQLYVGPSIGKPKVFLCFGGKLTATERGLIY